MAYLKFIPSDSYANEFTPSVGDTSTWHVGDIRFVEDDAAEAILDSAPAFFVRVNVTAWEG